jgi:hypothetical protein
MDEQQPELPLPFPELYGDMPLLPARMVNEYQYCPRLAYLEWVQGEWSDSADTVEGRYPAPPGGQGNPGICRRRARRRRVSATTPAPSPCPRIAWA